MKHIVRGLLFILTNLSLLPLAAMAQRYYISGPIDNSNMIALKSGLNPRAQSRYDEGMIDPVTKMDLITLMLKPSASQQVELEKLLTDQQNPSSPNYHRWLTPEEYADRFGASRDDIAKITAWLESEGLVVDDVARGRNSIMVHGSATQIQSAFHTKIHHYRVNGELHFANATAPSVPAAMEPLVMGVLGLDDFKLKPAEVHVKSRDTSTIAVKPRLTTSGGSHYMAPDDLATIYDIKPLYSSGIDGTGQKIVIAGQTNIALADIRSFQSQFKLSNKDPQILLVPGSTDPGTNADELGEADLDIEWSGAVARNATVIYVYSKNVINSVVYAINQNLAPVISLSYGDCEANQPSSSSGALRTIAQQGAAQGITWLTASGDSGAADCDPSFSASNATATHGIAVDFPGTIPEVTSVGGTQFNEGNGSYWNPTNSSTGSSVLSYVPETAWNETSVSNGLASTGGGLSTFYTKPSWQTGPGVPSANARSVPDVSLTAADHDGYAGVTGGNTVVFSGTSAATPAIAGMIVLLNQYQAAHGGTNGQGNINPTLYKLAQVATGVFHDITSGNNIVPCASSATGCSNGNYGYSAGVGYDLATGLGSIDANNLVTQWSKGVTTTTLQQPFALVPYSGNLQTGSAGTVLTNALAVVAQDANGIRIPGVTVTFAVVSGSGSVSPASAVTNSAGLAQTQMTLGSAAGIQMVTATAPQYVSTGFMEAVGSDTSVFSYRASTSGNNQTGTINTDLPIQLTLSITDNNGNPIQGLPFGWIVTGGGSVRNLSPLTDSGGKISAIWTLGSTVGTQTAQVRPFYYNGSSPFSGTTFSATAQTVQSNSPAPALTSIAPTSTTAGGAAFTLTVTGTNFINGSLVRWNGAARITTFVSATQLNASISASDITTAGTAAITVFTPAPGGGVSNSLNFAINNASGSNGPVVPANGILNGAGFDSSVAGVSQGAIVSVFGTNLSDAPAAGVFPGFAPGSTTQLSTSSNGTSVTFDGIPAPLFFVSPIQLNVQVPFEVAGKKSTQVVVSLNGKASPPVTVPVLDSTPGIFTYAGGKGPAIILNEDGSLNSGTNPAAENSVIQLFTTGLGEVFPTVPTGLLAPTSEPLARSTTPPTILLGAASSPAVVEFSGLAPGFVGLWQVNVRVPIGAGSGGRNLLLRTGQQTANLVTVYIQ